MKYNSVFWISFFSNRRSNFLLRFWGKKLCSLMWAAFPSVGPLPTVGMLSSPKKKRKVFIHNSRPLNGILVPLRAKWFPKKKKRSSPKIRWPQMETGDPWRLCGLSKNNNKVFNHNSGPPNGIRGSSTTKEISHHTTLGPLWWAPKMLFHGLLHTHGPGADCPL